MISKNKKILITWASWFVGSNLVRTLIEKWFSNVYIIIRKSTNLWRINDIKNKINISTISLLNKKELDKYINKIKPDIIYHLASSWTSIWENWINELFETNILGTINLINACQRNWFDYFINTWSSSEYWEKKWPMSETDILEPNNDYWITKATASMYVNYIWKKYNLPIYTFRLFSVYWYYEDKKRLIPTLILNYLNNNSPKLSNPNSVRDYIFIEDVINYYLNIDKLQLNYWWIYNIWNWKQYKIFEIVDIIKKINKLNINPTYWKTKIKQHEPEKWLANINKTKTTFWIKHHDIHEWLNKTNNWFKNNILIYEK